MNATVIQNISECLRSVNNIGSTTVFNVCTGTKTVVPWGVADWMEVVVLGVLIAVGMAIAVPFVTKFVRSWRRLRS